MQKQITIKDMIESLDYYDLLKIKDDISKGSFKLNKVIQDRIKKVEKEHLSLCATCSNEIDVSNRNTFTLVFGPDDFKKKATFCGKDCLQYFLAQLR